MGLFKKRSKRDILQKKYEKLIAEWHRLSTINRTASDAKYAEAQLVLHELDQYHK